MASQINIKSPETHRMATELSSLTGESLTTAVTKAIDMRLQKERQKVRRGRKGVAQKLLTLGKEASRMPVLDERDHAEMLYDADGLPKRRQS